MLYLPQHEPTQGQVLTFICSTSLSMTHPGSGINIYMLYLHQHEPTQGQVSTSICSTSLNMNTPRVRYQHLYALPPSTWTHPGSGINIYMLYLPQHEHTQGQVLTSICSTSLSMNPPRVRYQHLYALPPSTWTHPGSGINIYMLYLPQHEHTQGQVLTSICSTSLSMNPPRVNISMLYLPQHEHIQGQVSTSICSTSLSMNPPRVRWTSICSTSLSMNTPRVRYQHLYALPPSAFICSTSLPGSGINMNPPRVRY